MKNRKGQAALEFMMTYGWAILVVLAAIGALAYFGVFDTSSRTPESCFAAAPFGCSQGAPTSTVNSIAVPFVHNLGSATTFTFNASDLNTAAGCTNTPATILICGRGSTNITNCISATNLPAPGVQYSLVLGGCTFPNGVKIAKGDIKINYTDPASGYPADGKLSIVVKSSTNN